MGWRDELLESVEFNKSRLGTADAVNDLIVTDLLSGLGYNYKRSLDVRAMFTGLLSTQTISILQLQFFLLEAFWQMDLLCLTVQIM